MISFLSTLKSKTIAISLLSSVAFGQAVTGNSLNITGSGTITQSLTFGSNQSLLRNDQGGSLELGGNDNNASSNIPYIDFHSFYPTYSVTTKQDYNVRLINDVDRQLSLFGGLKIGPVMGGAINPTNSLRLDYGDFSMNGNGSFKIDQSNGNIGGRFNVQPNGFVGIGIANPVSTLHVNGLTVLGPDPGTTLMGQLNNCANLATGGAVPPLRLFANGTIGCTELRVNPTSWCDYVFDKEYKLKDLKEVEAFIDTTKHLPDVPSEKEVQNNGVFVSEMLKTHMRKIEELTLYLIEQNKKIEKLSTDNQKLITEIADLKKVVANNE